MSSLLPQSESQNVNLDLFSTLSTGGGETVTPPVSNPSESVLRKCLHPPSAVPGFCGLPTNDARTQVLLQYADIGINKTPIINDFGTNVFRYTTAADLATFDYALLVPNGLRVNSIPFVYNATGNTMTQDANNVDILDAYNTDHFHEDAQLYRPAYKSTTAMLNATYFNNTGLVACNQFNPNILFSGTILSMAHENAQAFYEYMRCRHRKIHHGLCSNARKVDHDVHLTNFSLFPTYIQTELRRVLELKDDQVPMIDPNLSIQIINFSNSGPVDVPPNQPTFVPTPSQLLNQSQRAYSGKAMDGCFSINRLNTVSPDWITAGNTSNAIATGLYECWTYFKDSTGAAHYNPLTDNVAPGATAITQLYDTLWSKDMTWSWIVFQGLSMNSQTSTSMQLLIKKYYMGFEVQPSPRSSWAGLTRLAPKPDLAAMQAMMDGFYELKDGMPARYNFWGTVGTILGPSLLQAGGSILKWLTGKIGGAPSAAAASAPITETPPVQPAQPKRVPMRAMQSVAQQPEYATSVRAPRLQIASARTRRAPARKAYIRPAAVAQFASQPISVRRNLPTRRATISTISNQLAQTNIQPKAQRRNQRRLPPVQTRGYANTLI